MSFKNNSKISRLIDCLDKKEAKSLFKQYLKNNELISKSKIINDISMKMFEHIWESAKKRNKKLNEREFLEILEGDLFRNE